jgi:hypothetical protein
MLKLDGDRTRLVEGGLPPAVIGPLLDQVALTRIANMPLPWPRESAGTTPTASR